MDALLKLKPRLFGALKKLQEAHADYGHVLEEMMPFASSPDHPTLNHFLKEKIADAEAGYEHWEDMVGNFNDLLFSERGRKPEPGHAPMIASMSPAEKVKVATALRAAADILDPKDKS